jgi:CRP/FNR family cyclic AMP-dependent transcriptional regulator
MEHPSPASVCQKGCLLEGMPPQRLPPCQRYQRGERIAPKDGIFLICRGPLGCLWGPEPERSCLEILGPGDVWESWEYAARECQAWALGEVRGYSLQRAQWLELLRNPIVEERLVNCMCQRSRRQSEWQLVLARGSVRARLAWHLVDLAQRFGERDEQTKEIFAPIALTQEQQAQLIGATRARLWEARREFEHKRWLICGPEGFWVRNEEALRRQSLEAF